MHIIIATWEVEIGKTDVQGHSGGKVSKISSKKVRLWEEGEEDIWIGFFLSTLDV
jgi:hypothetical protein